MYSYSSSNFLLPSNKKYLNCREFGSRILTQAESFSLILVIKKKKEKLLQLIVFMTKQKCQRKIFKWINNYCDSRVFIENLRVAFKRVLDLNNIVSKRRIEQFNFCNWLLHGKNLVLSNSSNTCEM